MDEASLFVGRDLGGVWRVVEVLGDGGFGMVFAAENTKTREQAAIKVLRITRAADPTAKLEFDDETRFLGLLRESDRVIDVLDHGVDIQILTATGPTGLPISIPFDFPYIVLELADGSLTELLTLDTEAFPWAQRLQVFRDAVKGVHQMHVKRIVDRDLKSENVLVFAPPHAGIRGKVADLGRARLTLEPPRFPADNYLVGRGDLRFAAPELFWFQGRDREDHWHAVDLYHLGSLLYELCTGIGITSVVLPDGRALATRMSSLLDSERAASYEASVPELRDRYEYALSLVVPSAPPSIRQGLLNTLRQLTDPVPTNRFPRIDGRRAGGTGLEWLVRRSDILLRTLRNAERQARRQSERKAYST